MAASSASVIADETLVGAVTGGGERTGACAISYEVSGSMHP